MNVGSRVCVTLRGDNPQYGTIVKISNRHAWIQFDGMRKRAAMVHNLDSTRYVVTEVQS